MTAVTIRNIKDETPVTLPDLESRCISPEEYGDAYRRQFPYTVRFLIALGADPELAEEAAQAAWAKGWERLSQLRNPDSLTAWVNSIAKNALRSAYQRNSRYEDLPALLNAAPDKRIEKIQAKQILERCPAKFRGLLSRCYVEGYTSEEIANQMGMTAVAVRVQIHRARQWLKKTVLAPLPSLDKAA